MFDEFIHHRARHQGFQPPAHQHIGLQAAGVALVDEAQRIVRSGFHQVADIGAEGYYLPVALARYIHLHRDKGCIDDTDANLLDGSDEVGLSIGIFAQDS